MSEKQAKKPAKKKQLPQFETFKARCPVFSTDPIPEEFKFPLFDLYVKPLKYELAPDPGYVEEKLIPHFEEVVNTLSPVINEILQYVNELDSKIAASADKPATKYKFNYFNADLWRKFTILYTSYLQTKDNLLASRYSILSKRAELLSQINNLAYFLAEHPRYYYINHVHAEQSWKSLEFDYVSSVYVQFSAIKMAIRDIEQQLKFIPHPFHVEEENVEFFKNLISIVSASADPITGYIPRCENTDMFAIFIDSRKSPVNISKGTTLPNEKFNKYLSYMIGKLAPYGSFEKNSREYKAVASLSARYLFEKFMLIENDKINCEKAEKKVWQFTDCPMKDIIAPLTIFNEQLLELKAKEFFKANIVSSAIPGELMSLVFDINPFDIGHKIYKISLSLILLLSKATGRKMEDLQGTEELNRIWGSLFVAAEIPGVFSVFKKFEKWCSILTMPKEFVDAASLPLAFINKKNK